MAQFWGKYRGTVVDNVDPLKLGRLQVFVPAVLGEVATAWAMPCVPYAGLQVGFFMMPPTGAAVWVEFEGGDPDYPIWSGCFWREGELPIAAELPTMRLIQTSGGLLQFNDVPAEGSMTLLVGDPAVAVPISIIANSTGLTISLAEIRLSMNESGVSITATPGVLSVTATGVTAAHGSANISAVEPEVSINESALSVI
jgi:type VI secretion system (T6SS) baseplate-like injector VgrG